MEIPWESTPRRSVSTIISAVVSACASDMPQARNTDTSWLWIFCDGTRIVRPPTNGWIGRSSHPADDAGHAIDGDRRALRDAPGRAEDAEHGGDPPLACERGKMRRAAAELGDDPRDARQDGGQRGAGDLRDQDVADLHVIEIVLVNDEARRPRRPPDPGRLATQAGVMPPELVFGMLRLQPERPRLDDEEPRGVLRPLDLDGRAERRFDGEHHPAQRDRVGLTET